MHGYVHNYTSISDSLVYMQCTCTCTCMYIRMCLCVYTCTVCMLCVFVCVFVCLPESRNYVVVTIGTQLSGMVVGTSMNELKVSNIYTCLLASNYGSS